MNVAKPPGGFKVVVMPAVQVMVDDLLAHHPELLRNWRAVIARLQESGHIAGAAVDGNPGQRVASFQPFDNGPILNLAWRVLGDTVTVLRAMF